MYYTTPINYSGSIQDGLPAEELALRSRTLASQIQRPNVHRSYIVPVLSKALNIMRLIETSERPMNIQEICEATGYSKTTVYRILRTLAAHGYMPNGSNGVYSFRHI